jgi:hypothetical protein
LQLLHVLGREAEALDQTPGPVEAVVEAARDADVVPDSVRQSRHLLLGLADALNMARQADDGVAALGAEDLPQRRAGGHRTIFRAGGRENLVFRSGDERLGRQRMVASHPCHQRAVDQVVLQRGAQQGSDDSTRCAVVANGHVAGVANVAG